MDTTKPEVSETKKEKQIEKVVSMEKKLEVCKIICIYVSCEFLAQWEGSFENWTCEWRIVLCFHS